MHAFEVRWIATLVGALGLMGCPPKTTEVIAQPAPTEAEAVEAERAATSSTITEAEVEELRANFNKVHFDFDRADLGEESRLLLQRNASILVDHPEVSVRVEGHADRWGSDIYNLALGQRRADSVRDYLVNLGVAPEQLQTVSYGEERPLIETDDGKEAQNRRAEFLVIVGQPGIESSY